MRSRSALARAFQALGRRPTFTASVVLTLALGVGANVAVFSLLDATLLRALPYAEPDLLVLIWEARPDRGWSRFGVSAPAFRDWRDHVASLEHVTAFYESQANVAGTTGPERVGVLHASAELLPALGLRPHLGRGLAAEDERAGSPVALLGYGFWQRAFGGDPGVLGRSVAVGRETVTVVGVLPPEVGAPFASPGPALVRPLAADDARRGARWLTVLARLAPGRTEPQARAELQALAERQAREYPDTNTGWTVTVAGLPEAAREDGRLTLLLLTGAVGLLLLLTSANVAHLLLVRTLGRERELLVRAALGAGPWGLAQPVLAEAAALTLLGGAAGFVAATAALGLLRSALPAELAAGATLDARAFAAGLGITALAGLLVALLPVLHALRARASGSLRAGDASRLTSGRGASRRALVVAELAIAFVLLAGAGVLVRTVRHLIEVDPGFRPEHALALRVAPPQVAPAEGQSEEEFIAALFDDRDRAAAFYARLQERLVALPGVRSAGAVNRLPLTGGWWVTGYEVAGQAPALPGEEKSAFGRVATPGYFQAMGITLREGRDFDARDGARGEGVVIVDEALALREFGERSPLGVTLRIDGDTDARIVGVVGATHATGLDSPPAPTFYVPLQQARFGFYPDWGMDVVVRAQGDPRALVPALRGLIRELDPSLPAFAVRTLDELVARALGTRSSVLRLLGAFSLLAALLAAVGLYGVLAQLARERSREFGVRLALGARPGEVGALVLKEGLKLAALGTVVGAAGSLLAGRALGELLYRVTPADPTALSLTAALLFGAAATAALPSVRRASRTDPAAVLRDE